MYICTRARMYLKTCKSERSNVCVYARARERERERERESMCVNAYAYARQVIKELFGIEDKDSPHLFKPCIAGGLMGINIDTPRGRRVLKQVSGREGGSEG
jgi:hypothetical protein